MTGFLNTLKSSFVIPAALVGVLAALLMIPGTGGSGQAAAQEAAVAVPPPAIDMPAAAGNGTQAAVLAGGCFWGMQGVFQHVKGVRSVLSGYSGGAASKAQYEEVSTGTTGHAESVQITFDPRIVSYGQILRIFFSVAHDPTELNRQGPDEGTQYRSTVFFANGGQKRVAEAYISQLNAAHIFGKPIATTLEAFKAFYPAESYHQDYLIHHPDQPYIVFNDLPKLRNLKRLFPEWYVEIPVTVASSDMR